MQSPVDHENNAEETAGVVIQLGCGVPNLAVVEAAMMLGRALSTAVEGLFIEEEALVDAATYSFTTEISYFSGRRRVITTERILADMQSSASAARQRLQAIAKAYDVALHYHVARRSSQQPFLGIGPHTRILVLSQPHVAAGGTSLYDVIQQMPAIEGFLVAGAAAKRRSGPILMAVQSVERLAGMLATTATLAASSGHKVVVLPTDPDPRFLEKLKAVLVANNATDQQGSFLSNPIPISPAALEGQVKRFDAGLFVMALGHPLTANKLRLATLAATLSTPLLLLRPSEKKEE